MMLLEISLVASVSSILRRYRSKSIVANSSTPSKAVPSDDRSRTAPCFYAQLYGARISETSILNSAIKGPLQPAEFTFKLTSNSVRQKYNYM